MSFGFAPKGWAFCNGQLLPINQNQALFALLGTTYGGDGRVNFGLPNLQGLVPIHMGSGHTLGERAGAEAVTLSISQLPGHVHFVNASNDNGAVGIPANNFLGAFNNAYSQLTSSTTLVPGTVGNMGGNQAHTNMQPFLILNFCIALQGIFPSQN